MIMFDNTRIVALEENLHSRNLDHQVIVSIVLSLPPSVYLSASLSLPVCGGTLEPKELIQVKV